ncbi:MULTISPECIES: ubiquinol-cytochrome c reductase iron-sulfur subunit [Pandoraea]|uniref:Ubiquinol-cytochrome c reductase iron-sulfur subunit n=1 Tax=Pandoraea commovens TaxID=2508289 RepID=A0A5E4YL43_9BURK|nr:ubiquinol-cytochrome c reductase iron-sulfur subunit [Pandoraea commovens]UVA79152.1 ubiquinol-cytochrome c reductase iron-sulfur subunit [Pandoraea commovens]VVE48703.1 ubiquinol-cytochrome c reductase iron-sulfur subunit [Pandoraea commovens]
MSNNQKRAVDSNRRNLLIATSVVGGVGGVVTVVPFVSSLEPSERAKAGGAPVEADISGLRPGEKMTVAWRGLPVWIVRRTPDEMASLSKVTAELADPDSKETFSFPMPDYAKNEFRTRVEHKDLLVVIGVCTHLGCIPSGPYVANTIPALGQDPGFLCPCHGSTYDMSGRVFKNKPAPKNLDVPRFMFLSDSKIVIGKDEKGEA